MGSATGLLSRSARGQTEMQISARAGISAGEQGHLVAQADKFVYQPRHHPLCPAVKLGRNALGQGRDLGNSHDSWSDLWLLRPCENNEDMPNVPSAVADFSRVEILRNVAQRLVPTVAHLTIKRLGPFPDRPFLGGNNTARRN